MEDSGGPCHHRRHHLRPLPRQLLTSPMFLSEMAPFPFPCFSIMCMGVAIMIAFVQSLVIKPAATNHKEICNESSAQP
ncbi:hypothetical protein MLD38_032252 [Melastoma candidum]|uniref:Uncharacterized protein n=1 Tax=Melastoma candidum TaxID=119954 RepID=A0ACB9M3C0_9MYRT|nr:hypothetical protein MLD38_032252 [Melastoma candidum]